MDDFCEEISAPPRSQEKERCQYTQKEFESENDKIYFRCGHYYHREAFKSKYVRLGVFVCGISGCVIKTPAERAQPPVRVYDVENERYVDEDDIDVEDDEGTVKKLLPRYIGKIREAQKVEREKKKKEKAERKEKRRVERIERKRLKELEEEMNSDADWTPSPITAMPMIHNTPSKPVSYCHMCGNARIKGNHRMKWASIDGGMKKYQICKGVDF